MRQITQKRCEPPSRELALALTCAARKLTAPRREGSRMGVGANKWVARRRLAAVAAVATVLLGGGAAAYAVYVPGIPPAVDPGTPTFAGLARYQFRYPASSCPAVM